MKQIGLMLGLLVSIQIQAQYSAYDWEDRDTWMKTTSLLAKAGVEIGDSVADIGCHEGYLSMHLARKVSTSGRVYSVDVRDDRLATLRRNANDRGFTNIVTILGDYDDPKLPDNTLDHVFVIDTYHEIRAHKKVLGHIRKALKKGGGLMVMEKLKKKVRGKSREDQVDAHSLSMGYVRKELELAGFEIVDQINDHGLWEREADKQMWVLFAIKP
ncbi:methyltransferase domain-containing protein [Flagellimonas allohymeniacidonis]|uniref:Methyltransferase domain-containing protein n=1 Tax=Flagellimonas allohymeniacidonis TaxID=2517819 RepID=A0A4Q8QIX0_9FLAO|nr:methyltransferase domain-containing protein [Allomuricauda hymeniacidonis]